MTRKYSFKDDAWFAGFVDGEGCFTSNNGGRNPKFQIGLRWDDRAILKALQAEFGGGLNSHRDRVDGFNRQTEVKWVISAKDDLRALVHYFERFPLRAKKRRQYQEWLATFPHYFGSLPKVPAPGHVRITGYDAFPVTVARP